MSDVLEKKRQTLNKLLIGKEEFPMRYEPAIKADSKIYKKEGVTIESIKYRSNVYPNYVTDFEDGETLDSGVVDNIPAFLLLPDKKKENGKGIVALHQHALDFDLGKSEPAGLKTGPSGGKNQHYGFELAQQGYQVICFDFPGFEERKIGLTAGLREEYGEIIPNVDERFLKQEFSLDGVELMGLYVSDTLKAVDVLEKQGITDIGIIGHSLGGSVLSYAMACDPRIKAGVASCGVTTHRAISLLPMIHNWSYSIHGMRSEFGEWHELCDLIKPRHLLISAGKNDPLFPRKGVEDFVRWGKELYGKELYGKYSGNLELKIHNGKHSFPPKARKQAYEFLAKHL